MMEVVEAKKTIVEVVVSVTRSNGICPITNGKGCTVHA